MSDSISQRHSAPSLQGRAGGESLNGYAKAWRETVTIPTYEVGEPEKNPIFLEKRVYQGSSGVVYPYPVIESIANEPTPHEWQAIWLENEYIKVMILPELGGRVQMAYDKIKQRHFVYYNHVIKPALVGLAGPWISGGIEFNWPQHHRPSTYMPVDSDIEEEADGSVVVWCSEMERMFHQKSTVGFRLRPGCAYLEINVRMYNRTELPQTFLWWANPAVEVNDYYQSVFPPDVNAVFDHGKRAVSSFPIATGTYYKMDYSAGVDISNYKNIKVPTSYMAVNSQYDFEGGYENDTKGGMLHVANHHVSPGKKQWTWGNGDFGRAWDRNLTEAAPLTPPEGGCWRGEVSDYKPSTSGKLEGGLYRPYIELMAGVYTENQPDFSWIMPYEEKEFTQYFMPYRELGIVKQASKDFIFNIEHLPSDNGHSSVRFKVLATSRQEVRVVLRRDNGEELYNKEASIDPETILDETVDIKDARFDELEFCIYKDKSLKSKDKGQGAKDNVHVMLSGVEKWSMVNVQLLRWHAESDDIRPIPDAAEAAKLPQDCKTVEQLYLTGLHLEQYRHATWSPLDYYEEGLRRDPLDVRCNNQTGLWYLRRGRFEKAEPYLRTAVKVLMKRNPNPYDGEALYNLGLCLKYQAILQFYDFTISLLPCAAKSLNRKSSNRKLNEAYDWFYKATWNGAWQGAAYFACAQISTMQGRWEDALYEVNRALVAGYHNQKARALKAVLLKEAGKTDEFAKLVTESLEQDRFNYGILFEAGETERIVTLMHGNPLNYHELALDYAQAGLWQRADAVLDLAIKEGAVNAMTYYYKMWINGEVCPLPDTEMPISLPNRLEDIVALNCVMKINEKDAMAPYLLGCLYYDKRQYDEAIRLWERSAELNPDCPQVWRNLALARFNKQGREDEAVAYMERAFHLDETDSRILMELDQLYKRLNRPHAERLSFMQRYPQLIQRRDDLVLEEITLLNQMGRYEEAKHKLDAHIFHPWEGGEGKVPAQYQICRVELAKQAISRKDYERAIGLLSECLEYPHHLGEGKLYGAQENDFYYLLGVAYDALGQKEKARECWEEATKGPQEPAAAMYYNDAKPDKIFYQGLALKRLGRDDEANGRFYRLINYGKQHIFEHQVMDYFAVSLPDLLIWEDSLDTKNCIHCKYMLALGFYGIGDKEKALKYLREVEDMDINHQGIQQIRSVI